MTNQDVLIIILSEASGRSKEYVRQVVEVARCKLPNRGPRFDEELAPEKAEELLSDLRAEKAGIRRFLEEGAQLVEFEMMHASKTAH